MNSKLSISLPDYITAKTLLLGAGALAAVYAFKELHRASQLPPGPWGLPLLGRLPWLDASHIEESQHEMAIKYGPIYSFRAGQRLMVVISSAEIMRQMFKEDVFLGRLLPPPVKESSRGCGIVFTEGKTWMDQRRICLRVLRDFGFGKAQSINVINDEVSNILSSIDVQPLNVDTFMLFTSLSNSTVATLMFGRRYANEDKRFDQFIADLHVLSELGLFGFLSLLFPVLERVSWLIPETNIALSTVKSVQNFIEQEVAAREADLADSGDEPLCVCDAYIQERRRAEAKGDFETFDPFHVVQVGSEMFIAGTDTTARSLEWLLALMSLHHKIQAKVQQEIDDLVGSERRPQVDDRDKLHYTMAVIDESLRFASLVSTGLPHRALTETTFRGYRIPSDAVIVPLVYGAHRDAAVWKKPFDFFPEHFLDAQGRYSPSKNLVPFSAGKRSCLGEALARLEIFLAFAAVMQRFSVKLAASSEGKRDEILRGRAVSSRSAGEHLIDFVKRCD